MTNMEQVDQKTVDERIKAQRAEARAQMLAKIQRLAGLGLTQEQISLALGYAKGWVAAHKMKDPELAMAVDQGKSVAISLVANALFETARKGNVTAQIFFLKARAGWREDQYVHADIQSAVSVRSMSDAELEALAHSAPEGGAGGGE